MNIDKIDTEIFKAQSVAVLLLSSVRVLLLSLHLWNWIKRTTQKII